LVLVVPTQVAVVPLGAPNAVKLAGAPTPATVAETVLEPRVLPRVKVVRARPFTSLTLLGVPRVPAPPVRAKVTVAPGTTLVHASRTRATSGVPTARFTMPPWKAPESGSTCDGGPAASTSVLAADVKVPLLKVSCLLPTVAPTAKPLKVATPFTMGAEPPMSAVAAGSDAAVIVPEALVTTLPAASTTCTTGCVASATPALPVPEGATW
jgi:hypothetical protein